MVALYLGVLLRYDFLRSDVLGYWQDSLAWRTPFHPFHVPLYPLVIALVRGITFDVLPPVLLMMSINLGAFLASAFLIYRILQAGGASDELAAIGAFLFGLWPFVGLTYTVNPQADMPAMLFLLVGLYLLQGSRKLPAALLLGLSLVTHKATWIFVGLLTVSELLHCKEYISKRNLQFIGIILLPIGLLWTLGSFYHRSITWLFSSNLRVEVAPRSMPLLDGLFGTFMGGGIKGLAKGMLLSSFATISTLACYASVKYRYRYFHHGVAISLAILILFLILNQREIWAAMRFSRLLVIPLVLISSNRDSFGKHLRWSLLATVVFSMLFLSQLAYAWYMARIYFG